MVYQLVKTETRYKVAVCPYSNKISLFAKAKQKQLREKELWLQVLHRIVITVFSTNAS